MEIQAASAADEECSRLYQKLHELRDWPAKVEKAGKVELSDAQPEESEESEDSEESEESEESESEESEESEKQKKKKKKQKKKAKQQGEQPQVKQTGKKRKAPHAKTPKKKKPKKEDEPSRREYVREGCGSQVALSLLATAGRSCRCGNGERPSRDLWFAGPALRIRDRSSSCDHRSSSLARSS